MNETDFFAYEPICYGVLSSLNFRPGDQDYEDYLQSARLALLTFLKDTTLPLKDSEEEHLLKGFLYQHIRWYVIDLFRKKRMRQLSPLDDLYDNTPSKEDLLQEVFDHCLMHELEHCLSPQEWLYLKKLLHEQPTAQIAKSLGVSRQALYKWRKNIQKKIFFLISG